MRDILQHPFFAERFENRINIVSENADLAFNNMKKFIFENKVQMTMFLFVARNVIDRNGYSWVKRLFQEIDQKSTGRITKQDFGDFYKKINQKKSSTEINQIFSNLDFQSRNFIEYEEFLLGSISKEHVVNEQVINKFFDFFDENHQEVIQVQKFKEVFFNFTEEEQMEIFEQIDSNKNGEIDRQEFQKIFYEIASGMI